MIFWKEIAKMSLKDAKISLYQCLKVLKSKIILILDPKILNSTFGMPPALCPASGPSADLRMRRGLAVSWN